VGYQRRRRIQTFQNISSSVYIYRPSLTASPSPRSSIGLDSSLQSLLQKTKKQPPPLRLPRHRRSHPFTFQKLLSRAQASSPEKGRPQDKDGSLPAESRKRKKKAQFYRWTRQFIYLSPPPATQARPTPLALSTATPTLPMSSPVSCQSPSQSPYCSPFSTYNGTDYSQSPGYASGVSTPTSITFKEEPFSPIMYSSPSPTYEPSRHSTSSAINIVPSNDPFYRTQYANAMDSPVASPPHYAPYPQEYYRAQSAAPQSLSPINTQHYPYSHQQHSPSLSPPPPTSPYSRRRRSLPPVDPTRLDDEVWVTSNGKKVRQSAMHLHCATM